MRDAVITGAALVRPAAALSLGDAEADRAARTNDDLKPARWTHQPAKLARMDRLCALALVAADGALADARLALPESAAFAARSSPSGAVEEAGARVAVVVGTALGCVATNESYYRGWYGTEGGAAQASPRLFAYTLPSSPLGEITIHYGARGPAETLATGRAAGLAALAEAVRLVESGRASIAIAVAVDAAAPSLARFGLRVVDGAAAFVVEEAAEAVARGAVARGRLRAVGEAFGQRALARAIEHARAATSDPEAHAPPILDGDDAVSPCAALVEHLHSPSPSAADARALIAAGDASEQHAATALVVERAHG